MLAGFQGKDIVDIREEWSEELHGGSGGRAAGAGGGFGSDLEPDPEEGAGGAMGDEGASDSEASTDSFEALMRQMDELEVDEAEWQATGGGAAPSPAAATIAPARSEASTSDGPGLADDPSAVTHSSSSSSSRDTASRKSLPTSTQQAGKRGAFKPGFLLGKRLDGPAPHVKEQARSSASQHGTAAADEGSQRQREAVREAVFTGRVMERPAGPAAAERIPVGAAGAVRQSEQHHEGLQENAAQQQPQPHDTPQQPRVSKFKLRCAGLA